MEYTVNYNEKLKTQKRSIISKTDWKRISLGVFVYLFSSGVFALVFRGSPKLAVLFIVLCGLGLYFDTIFEWQYYYPLDKCNY
jgi:hypothetical protein